jgi:uncharacterized membrane protein (DUF373 family)
MTYLDKFQKIIISILTWLMAFAVLMATVNLVYILVSGLITPPFVILQIDELLGFFGGVLLVLIGVELLETFKAFQLDKTVNVMMVFLVALIAMARKVILMEMNGASDNLELIGLSAIIISLSIGYYLIKKSTSREG